MANTSGNAYGLTAFIPIKNGYSNDGSSHDSLIRSLLQSPQWPLEHRSPMAKVPNTYLCRFYLLNDVFYEGKPEKEEHLKSKYLVFSSNFHGDLDKYLQGMWQNIQDKLKELLIHCVAFDRVKTIDDFVSYIKRCQVNNDLFFNGSTDDSLPEQLKSLYLKQALSHFVFAHQPLIQKGVESAAELQRAFKAFVEHTQPSNLSEPTWTPGSETEPEGLEETIRNL